MPPADAASPRQAGPSVRWMLAFVATFVAYAVLGLAALSIAIPPGYASPLYPAAGVALVSVLLYGWRMAAAASLAAFTVNLANLAAGGLPAPSALVVPAIIALGAGLQALAGAALVQRHVRRLAALDEPRDIALFFALGAPLACMVSPSIGHAALVASGTIPASELLLSWITWWAGDTLGVLIAAPIALTLVGRPRADWAPRRMTVGLPLAVVTLLLVLGILQVLRFDRDRLQGTFERDAASASAAMAAELREPLRALEAMRGVFVASDDVTRDEMRRAAAAWLELGHLQAIGWSERVPREAVGRFEEAVRAEGMSAFRVFDRADAPAPPDGEPVVAIRYIEPLVDNAPALGVNALSIPQARAAILAASRSGEPSASAGMRLTQSRPDDPASGVVLYQALYAGSPATADERSASLRGVVFVTLRIDQLMSAMSRQMPAYLRVCVIDAEPGARRVLAGPADCEAGAGSFSHRRTLSFGGRQWELAISAPVAGVPDARNANVWLFSLVGLMAAAMLGALLLTVTGRTQRIEVAVRERTAALEGEVRERELAQAALRESEQRFRNILNTVPIGIIYTDLDGRVKQTNPRLRELLGYSENELRNRPASAYIHPDDATEDAALSAQLVRGEVPLVRREMRFITKSHAVLWVQATTTLLRDAKGRPRRIVGVVEDISEHLRLQEAEHARELAEAANRAKSDFLSRMSHELRTPLNAMLGFAQLLELDQRQPLADNQRPWVTQIQQAGWHLLAMINDVLDLSRIESGNLRLHSEPVDLAGLLRASVALVDGDAERRGVRITTEIDADATTLLGDATRIKQILTNLLSNATKYNQDGGQIHVHAQALDETQTAIVVSDTGLGMTPQQLDELFQPFNRLGRERSGQQGTGIGLVISKRLAELMGGTLHASSAVGEGSAFTLTLPRLADPDTVPSGLQPMPGNESDYHQRVVHYVEDNETNVEVMRGILAQRPQVRLEVSLTGLDGLARIRTSPPDLVLLDMHLPDIQGIELLRHLKADPETAGIPVVVVSADALAAQIEQAMSAGATRYLTKPVGVAELLDVIDGLLEAMDTRYG